MEMYAEGRCTDYRLQYASMPPSVAALQLHLQTILASNKGPKTTHLWTPPNQVLSNQQLLVFAVFYTVYWAVAAAYPAA